MTGSPVDAPLVERLARARAGGPPVIAVELRPPPADLDPGEAMDIWIDLHQVLRQLARDDRFLFLTDNAVGAAEEENLTHLLANLPEGATASWVSPILTSKHTLDYCLLYAHRAWRAGVRALTVVGGDREVGPPRCLPHAYLLRDRIRTQVPGMALGGWANPHRPAREQARFLRAPDAYADYYLTQVVSHHDGDRLTRLMEAVDEAGEAAGADPLNGLAGIFLYRSANPATLRRLARFFPVPEAGIRADFEAGMTPEAICARSVRWALESGAPGVYLSNLGFRGAAGRLRGILAEIGTPV